MTRALRQIALMAAAQATIFLLTTAAQSKVSEGCDLQIFKISDAKSFLAFDKELRSALSQGDAAKMALLVSYPLNVGDAAGGYQITDPASFQGHFESIFPASLRKQIASEPLEKIWCHYTGISYSNGVLWVEVTDHGYRVGSVNLPAHAATPVGARRIELVCRTKKLRAVVETEKDSRRSHLRVWNDSRTLNEKPDFTVEGVEILEGTGECSHAYWKFELGDRIIQLDDARGCHEKGSEPPQGVTGRITFTQAKAQDSSTWCY